MVLTVFWLCVGSGSTPCLSCRESAERCRRLQDQVQQMEVRRVKEVCVTMLWILLGLAALHCAGASEWLWSGLGGRGHRRFSWERADPQLRWWPLADRCFTFYSLAALSWNVYWAACPPSSPDTSADGGFHVNFGLVLQRIKELNFLTGDGEAFVQATARGARLAWKDPVQLRLYSNGIVMFDGPFRSYEEHSTQVCCSEDIYKNLPAQVIKTICPLVLTAVHAGHHGWLFSIRAPAQISRRSAFWGAYLLFSVHVVIQIPH